MGGWVGGWSSLVRRCLGCVEAGARGVAVIGERGVNYKVGILGARDANDMVLLLMQCVTVAAAISSSSSTALPRRVHGHASLTSGIALRTPAQRTPASADCVPSRSRLAIPLMREEQPLTAAARGVNTVLTEGLPAWTLGAAAVGVLCPTACSAFGTTAAFARGLAMLMLSSGLQLTPRDLTLALRSPRALLLNAVCCFAVAPACALGLGGLLGAGHELSSGLVLMGCVSGGQASNLFASLAGGDLALSVVLTVSIRCSAPAWGDTS